MRTYKSPYLKQLDGIQDHHDFEYRRTVDVLQCRAHCEIGEAPSRAVIREAGSVPNARIHLVRLGDNRTKDAPATEAYYIQWVSGRQTELADLYVAKVTDGKVSTPIRRHWRDLDDTTRQTLASLATQHSQR